MRKLLLSNLLVFIVFLIMGCSNTSVLLDQEPSESAETDYTLIFYIHGDSDYLYHTEDGTPVKADQQALLKAIDVAEQATSGEVFIYHHQPAKRFLWIIPRRSNDLYHYKNGERVHHINYRRSSDELFMQTESTLYHTYRSIVNNTDQPIYLLYFGHEIPARSYRGYHHSQPNIVVDSEAFANGAHQFLDGNQRLFDLMVLSTCSNGTPVMVKQLDGVTNYLLASPQNLHLSHIDISALNLLESNPELSAPTVASAIAEETYDRLSESIQTVISLSIFDLNIIRKYINDLYEDTLAYEESENPNPYKDNNDCSELPFFDDTRYTSGVDVLFRPPRFGHRTSETIHSGWGCKVE